MVFQQYGMPCKAYALFGRVPRLRSCTIIAACVAWVRAQVFGGKDFTLLDQPFCTAVSWNVFTRQIWIVITRTISRRCRLFAIRLNGCPYLWEGLLITADIFSLLGGAPLPGKGYVIWLASFARLKSTSRLAGSWLRLPACRLKPFTWLKAPTDYW